MELHEILNKVEAKIGIIFLSITLLLSILRDSPQDWLAKLGAWSTVLTNPYFGALLFFLQIIFFLGSIIFFVKIWSNSSTQPQTSSPCVQLLPYTAEEFRIIFRKMVDAKVHELCIFGYTSETLTDFIQYKDRYENFTLKILLRDWNVEWDEEKKYNSNHTGNRPWDKMKHLKIKAQEWNEASSGELNYRVILRFYKEAPVFKGIIAKFKDHEDVYLGLYKWEAVPQNGGSQYKGDNGAVVFLKSNSENPLEQILCERTISQFNRLWDNGKRYEEVLASENIDKISKE